MKHYKWILAALLAVGGMAAAPAAAQTRVSVSVGFGDPYVSGYVVVGRPGYRYRRYYDRLYYQRPYYYRYDRGRYVLVGPEVIVVPRRPYHRRHHRGRHW